MNEGFFDRSEAGERLADALADVPSDALILGIPRGGVIVARAVADKLGATLDVVVAHKLGAPGNPELAIGAIGPDGSAVLDEAVLSALDGVPEAYVQGEVARQGEEIARRMSSYRGSRPPLDPSGRTCILVDDGIATGSTARAALEWLRRAGAGRSILAVPVAPAETVTRLGKVADRVVCLLTPRTFLAVGQWYDRFEQVSDDDVMAALARV